MRANRTLLPYEIQFAILFCSTNYMCNPLAHPEENLHPNSALYASFQSASIQSYDQVKFESLDPTVPVTFPNDDSDFQHHHHTGDDDDLIEVKPERIECTQEISVRMEDEDEDQEEHAHRRRIIKEEVIEDEEMQKSSVKSPTPLQVDESVHNHRSPALLYPENVDLRTEEKSGYFSTSSPAISLSRNNNYEAEEEVDADTAVSPIMSLDIMDIDAFLGGAFENLNSKKQKEREDKLEEAKKAECKRQEEAKEAEIKRQQDEIIRQQEAEKSRKLREQVERERLQYEEQLQQRITTSVVRPLEEDIVMEPLDGPVDEPEEEIVQQERENTYNNSNNNNNNNSNNNSNDDTIDYRSDPTIIRIEEPDPSRGRYCRIIYRNLNVNPQPAKPANGAINYKRFKKVKQFENYSSFNSSQTFATTPSLSSQNKRPSRGKNHYSYIHNTYK
jgi:hypothetical protein